MHVLRLRLFSAGLVRVSGLARLPSNLCSRCRRDNQLAAAVASVNFHREENYE